jgi:hypothetical protein
MKMHGIFTSAVLLIGASSCAAEPDLELYHAILDNPERMIPGIHSLKESLDDASERIGNIVPVCMDPVRVNTPDGRNLCNNAKLHSTRKLGLQVYKSTKATCEYILEQNEQVGKEACEKYLESWQQLYQIDSKMNKIFATLPPLDPKQLNKKAIADVESDQPPAPKPLSSDNEIVGSWRADPHLSQLGLVQNTYSFRNDGTYSQITNFFSFCEERYEQDCEYFWTVTDGDYSFTEGKLKLYPKKQTRVTQKKGGSAPTRSSERYNHKIEYSFEKVEIIDGNLSITRGESEPVLLKPHVPSEEDLKAPTEEQLLEYYKNVIK